MNVTLQGECECKKLAPKLRPVSEGAIEHYSKAGESGNSLLRL